MRHIAAILFLAATLAACSGGSTGGGTTIELTAADSGSAKPAMVGDTIVISLPANPTTGYAWQQVPGLDGSVVSFVSDDYEQAPASPNVVGAGGTETLTYKAVGEGTTTITLAYQRAGDTTAAESFTVTVTVSR
jgi:inhibitor of cysteine peptidase